MDKKGYNMEIKDILGKDKVTLSFEVFPPKQTSNSEEVERAAYGVAELLSLIHI